MRNDERHLAAALESGLGQTYPHIQYIVKDGLSTDGTLQIAERYRARLATLVSCADRGISDAWNQALAHATGSHVLLLNSDDRIDADLVGIALRRLADTGADVAYGDTVVTHDDGGTRRIAGRWRPARLWQGIGFLHPGVLCTRQAYERIGGFDPTLRYAMDADWLIRAHAAGLRFVSHGATSHMAGTGVSNRQWLATRREYLAVLARHQASGLTMLLARCWLLALRVRKALRPA